MKKDKELFIVANVIDCVLILFESQFMSELDVKTKFSILLNVKNVSPSSFGPFGVKLKRQKWFFINELFVKFDNAIVSIVFIDIQSGIN